MWIGIFFGISNIALAIIAITIAIRSARQTAKSAEAQIKVISEQTERLSAEHQKSIKLLTEMIVYQLLNDIDAINWDIEDAEMQLSQAEKFVMGRFPEDKAEEIKWHKANIARLITKRDSYTKRCRELNGILASIGLMGSEYK